MASSLKISYAQIPFNSVSITPSVAADTNNNEWNLTAGPRYQRFFYGSAATSRSTVYDIGTTYASKDSTVDHIVIARADFLQDDGTTTITLASSPDNATWTDRIASSTIATDTLTGPRANDIVVTGGPPVIGGCKLWLDATKGITKDGSNLVSQWSDQSGNSNHATQGTATNQPLWVTASINSNPSVLFDGVDNKMETPYLPTIAGGYTIICVAKPTEVTTTTYLVGCRNSGTGDARPSLFQSGGALYFRVYSNSSTYIGRYTAAGVVAIGSTAVIVCTYDGGTSASGCKIYVNGTQVDTTNDTAGVYAVPGVSVLPVAIGTQWSGGGNYYPGNLPEVSIFEKELGTTDRQTVEAYLTAKWITSPSTTQILESPQVRYWRVTYSGSSQVYRHSKCYFGKFFTFDYDPTYEIDFIPAKDSVWYASSGAAHFVRPGDPIYRITLTATAMSDTNVKSFEDKIARYAHRTPVFLHDIKVPEVLNNVSPIHAWLVDYSVEKVAYNYNQMTMVFEEALG